MSFYERNKLRARAEEAERRLESNSIRVAANALILADEDVLLVEFNGGSPRRHYNFPGGGVNAGETLEDALRREVREETCLDVVVDRLLLVVESVASRNRNIVGGRAVPWNELRFFFLCAPTPGSTARLPDAPDEDQTDVMWVPLANLDSCGVLPPVADHLLAAMHDPSRVTVVPNPFNPDD